uniref:endo-1,4-beta-xylanase n=1 Tax=uncultured bacterium contig00132 TaxID=1181581 RepID=A0A806KPT6_9BACT|nr:endo-1,4-beta-xylanase C precursor [uncultured bacterium contig00132]
MPLFAQVDACTQNTQLTGGTTLSITGSNPSRQVGTVGSFDYEVWHAANECTSTNTMTYYGADKGGGAAFKAQWTQGSQCDFLARIGYKFDEGKTYKQYGDIFADYNYTRSGNNTAGDYSYIGIYGWVRKTNSTRTVEYYIVDDWFGNQWQSDATPVGPGTICNNCSSVGTFTVDGSSYNVYKHTRENAYSIDSDNDTFDQYFSVRQTPRKCGTISITEHFKKWEELELPMSGTLYEAKILAEAGGGNGNIDYRYATMRMGDLCEAGRFPLWATASPASGGSINKNNDNICLAPNTSVTISATAAEGWSFDGWVLDGVTGSATANPLTVTTGNGVASVTAKFALNITGENLIKDSEFSKALGTDWRFQANDGATGSGSVSNGTFTANLTKLNNEGEGGIWSLQLVQAGLPLLEGNTYVLSFEASAVSPRTIQVMCQMENSPWTTYFEEDVSLTATMQPFTYEFTMNAANDPEARIGFNFAQSLENVSIRNVSVVLKGTGGGDSSSSGEVSSSSSEEEQSSSSSEDGSSSSSEDDSPIRLVNPLSKVDFRVSSLNGALQIESRASASIYLYDIRGNKVLSFNVPAGESIVKLSLPSGIYIVKNARSKKAQKVMIK